MDLWGLPAWIVWGLAAIALLIAEMVTTAYIALGFSVGAAIVALVTYFLPELHAFTQGFIWAGSGLVVWLGLAQWSRSRRSRHPDINDFNPLDSLPKADRQRRGQEKGDPEV